MRSGFTLIEVVVALVLLEVAVLGVLGTAVVASESLRRAERLERATGRVEALLDSLSRGASPDTVSESFADVRVAWSVDGLGHLVVHATDAGGGSLLTVESRVRIR